MQFKSLARVHGGLRGPEVRFQVDMHYTRTLEPPDISQAQARHVALDVHCVKLHHIFITSTDGRFRWIALS